MPSLQAQLEYFNRFTKKGYKQTNSSMKDTQNKIHYGHQMPDTMGCSMNYDIIRYYYAVMK